MPLPRVSQRDEAALLQLVQSAGWGLSRDDLCRVHHVAKRAPSVLAALAERDALERDELLFATGWKRYGRVRVSRNPSLTPRLLFEITLFCI
jgi:hypothetical protein